MKTLRKPSLDDPGLRRVVALVCLTLFLALELFAFAPGLHKLIHSDADSTSHHCAITLFSQGNVSAADTSVALVIFVAALLFSLPVLQSAIFPRLDCRLSPSRAPPAA